MKTGGRVLIVLFWFMGVAQGAEPTPWRDYSARCAEYYANVYQVPVELVDAVIEVESNWQPYAVSPKGAAPMKTTRFSSAAGAGRAISASLNLASQGKSTFNCSCRALSHSETGGAAGAAQGALASASRRESAP